MPNPQEKYDRQLIVMFDPDDVIRRGSTALNEFATRCGLPSEIVDATAPGPEAEKLLRTALSKLTWKSRLYLRGHGDWKSQHLGSLNPKRVARRLSRNGLCSAPLISITGCCLAKNRKHTDHQVVDTAFANSMKSFAQQFHWFLMQDYGIGCALVARLRKLSVANTQFDPMNQGMKFTSRDGKNYYHQPRSKVRFVWVSEFKQRIEYVDYAGPEEDADDFE